MEHHAMRCLTTLARRTTARSQAAEFHTWRPHRAHHDTPADASIIVTPTDNHSSRSLRAIDPADAATVDRRSAGERAPRDYSR